MSDPIDRMYQEEIYAESVFSPTDEEIRMAYNIEAVRGLKHAKKPVCDDNALRIKLLYTPFVNGRACTDQVKAFDNTVQTMHFVRNQPVEVQSIYWFEDNSVAAFTEFVNSRVHAGIKQPLKN